MTQWKFVDAGDRYYYIKSVEDENECMLQNNNFHGTGEHNVSPKSMPQ
jgi:hypothetical protein